MSNQSEVNPADAPVGAAVLPLRASRNAAGLVPWAPNGIVMGLTFARAATGPALD